MTGRLTVAIDAMSGDRGASELVPAVLGLAAESDELGLLLVGQPDAIDPHLSRLPGRVRDRVRSHAASEVVGMDEPPADALRRKRDSSMRVAVQQVRDGHAQAAVSAGNTGALMAISRYLLKTCDGIDRPAIATQLPNARGGATTVLDLGANVDCAAEHLLQFAVMGSALVSALGDVTQPTVGLLNIGEEVIKGNDVIKKAGELLRESYLQPVVLYHGEDQIELDPADVVRLAPLARAAGELRNEAWGPLMRSGNDKSLFARQVERYADVYTSRVSNLLALTPFVYLRSPRGSLPHDPVRGIEPDPVSGDPGFA